MPIYNDLFMRDVLGDTGSYPSSARSAYHSPDVVVWGTSIITDPQKFLSENYGTAWYKNVIYGQKNFIYCRAKNLFPGSQTGKLYLRYANSGLLANVSTWRNNIIGTAIPGQNFIKLQAARGEVVVGDSAFEWTPPKPPAGAHYCLVAQVVTEQHTNDLPERFTSHEDYIRWVLDNPAIGWRNIQVVDTMSPPEYQEAFEFENLESVEREFLFLMEAENIPANSTLSFLCGAIGPDPAIDRSMISSGKNREQLVQTFRLPPSFASYITATVKLAPGHTWDGDKTVKLELYVIMDNGDSDYLRSFARPISSIVRGQHDLAARQGTAVRLGAYTVQTATMETTRQAT